MLSKEEIGLKIKKAREAYSEKIGFEFTQAKLAKNAGVTRVYINDLEAGRSYPSLEKLQLIVAA